MKYHHRFQVKAPLSEVAAFHRLPDSMGAITPPPIRVESHRAPSELSDGAEMEFTLHFGPVHLPWLARMENVTDSGFTDRQVHGPFEEWSHQHIFNQVGADVTEVIDQVTAQVKRSMGGYIVGWTMWLGMPFLFAYRGWKTRSLLER